MKRTIDDLRMVRVSILVAHGYIACGAVTALIRFGDDGVEYEVGVRMTQFPNGGFWARFVCPRCDGGSQRLRLLDDRPACGKCVRASGLIYRSQSIRTEKRHIVTAPPRLARLNSDRPLRVVPRPRPHARPSREPRVYVAATRDRRRKHGVDRAKDQGL